MKNIKVILGIFILGIAIICGLFLWAQSTQKKQVFKTTGGVIDKGQANGAGLLLSEKQRDAASQELGIKLLFSPEPIEESITYEVKAGESLTSIAKQFGTTIDLIKASNSLNGETIRVGQKLKIIKGEFKIEVNVSNNILSLFLSGKLVKTYPVATASKDRNTPLGEFKIINRIIEPTWYAPDGVYPYGDPKNIIGTRWMGINEPGYGIHGTSDPSSIGKYVSQGCIRMYNQDVEELFKIVPVGTRVSIVKNKEQ